MKSMHRTFVLALLSVVVASSAMAAPAFAHEDAIGLSGIVQQVPVSYTPTIAEVNPNVADPDVTAEDEINAFAAAGGATPIMYAGGKFKKVISADGTTPYARKNLFAFNPKTGEVTSFAPNMAGQVEALMVHGGFLYVAGSFTSVNGFATGSVVRFNLATLKLDKTWLPRPRVATAGVWGSAKVSDIDVAYNSIVISGKFSKIETTVSGTTTSFTRAGLANLSTTNGNALTNINLTMTGALQYKTRTCVIGGYRMAINQQKERLVVSGCFRRVANLYRQQFVVIDISAPTAVVADWRSPQAYKASGDAELGGVCYRHANLATVEDLDFDPSGQYFYGSSGALQPPLLDDICSSVFKFDAYAVGLNVQATWIRKSSNDSLRSVESGGSMAYTAGHQRELFHPDFVAGFARPGITALSAAGAIQPWNPGKGRAIGSRELYITDSTVHTGFPTGLWVGSDSGECGFNVGVTRSTRGLCFFPQ